MLRLYRRHVDTCRHKDDGAAFRECRCPVWAIGKVDGAMVRRSLKTRDWDEAANILDGAVPDSRRAPVDEVMAARAVLAAADHCADQGPLTYLIGGTRAVKIGYALNPKDRLASLQTASPEVMIIRRVLHGGPALEAKLHSIFRPFERRGEWFRYSTTIREFIERTKALDPRTDFVQRGKTA